MIHTLPPWRDQSTLETAPGGVVTRTHPFGWIRTVTTLARHSTDATHPSGFSFIEVLMVLALIGIIAGMAVPISASMIARAKADSTSLETLTWLEAARNRAAAERRNFEVTFDTGTNHVRIDRVEADLSKTLILDRELPDGMKFMQFSGSPDTPDLFGNGAVVDFDGPAPHMFTSDGSLVDANGDPSNGTIFMGKTGKVETGRAITVFGMSGLLRKWKLSGTQWN